VSPDAVPDAVPDATPDSDRDRATEDRILAGAHAVFLRHGTAGARMQDIADEAGVNKALLHYYFRSKDRLAEEVFRRTFAGVMPRVFQTLVADLPLEGKVREVARIYLDALGRNPFLPGYLLCEMNQHPDRLLAVVASIAPVPLDRIADRVLGPLRRQLDDDARAGRIRPIAAEHFVVNLFALCIFPLAARPLLRIVLGLDAEGWASFVATREQEVADFFLAALRPRTPA
jgi:TetR/AcrR family transcriptional regulator